jgi:type II secretory pathway pseudopilin PulG
MRSGVAVHRIPALRHRERGALLLEVVLALVLFVVAAAIISGGISASMNSVERQRLNAHASNLAASILAELQMGARTLEEMGPMEFEAPFTGWSWEIVPAATAPGDDLSGAPQLIEVIVRHEDPPLVHRLSQSIRVGAARKSDAGDFGMDGGF